MTDLIDDIFKVFPETWVLDVTTVFNHVAEDFWIMFHTVVNIVVAKINTLLWSPKMTAQKVTREEIPANVICTLFNI